MESRRREAREGEGASAEAGAVKNNSVSSSLSHKVCASNQVSVYAIACCKFKIEMLVPEA